MLLNCKSTLGFIGSYSNPTLTHFLTFLRNLTSIYICLIAETNQQVILKTSLISSLFIISKLNNFQQYFVI